MVNIKLNAIKLIKISVYDLRKYVSIKKKCFKLFKYHNAVY